MVQYIVFQGLLARNAKEKNRVVTYFKNNKWGKVKYVMQFKTISGHGGSGGRNDVIYAWYPKHNEVGTFSIQRFSMPNPPRWLGDYIHNNSDIIPANILIKLKTMRDKTSDYGAGED